MKTLLALLLAVLLCGCGHFQVYAAGVPVNEPARQARTSDAETALQIAAMIAAGALLGTLLAANN